MGEPREAVDFTPENEPDRESSWQTINESGELAVRRPSKIRSNNLPEQDVA